MKKTIVCLMIVALSMCIAFANGSNEATGGKVVIKIGNTVTQDHAWNVAIDKMAELAKEYSNGRIEIQCYPNNTLGNESDMIESLRNGTLQMQVADPSAGSSFCKQFDLFVLPFLWRDKDHWTKVLYGPIGKEYSELIEKECGIKILGYWGGVSRNIISTKKQIKSIDDLQGFKLRLAQSELKFKVWNAVGALPVAISLSETYSAMQSGVCDGMENEMPSLLTGKFYEPAKNMTMTEHEITVRPLMINAAFYNSLDDECRDALDKAVAEATILARELEAKAAEEAKKAMVETYGVQVFEIDKQPLIDRTAKVFEEFGKETGLTDVIEAIKNTK